MLESNKQVPFDTSNRRVFYYQAHDFFIPLLVLWLSWKKYHETSLPQFRMKEVKPNK